MQQTCIVTCPFMENKIQLFYEASLHRNTHNVVIKIFNHRGVLKNKRVIELGAEVYDIFCTEEYIIGLDKDHQKVSIIDVRKSRKNIARGVIRQINGLTKQLKAKKLRFNSFIFDKVSNLIFGSYGNHYVFYFRINNFMDDSFSNDSFYHNNEEELAQANRSISINKIIQSTQSIDKLQIKNQKIKRKQTLTTKIKKTEQKQILNCLQQEQQNDNHNKYQIKTLICLLIKEKHLLRIVEIDWNKDQIKTTKQHQQVHDFCFLNGWDLIISLRKQTKKQKIPKNSQQNRYFIKTQHQGLFQQYISLSSEYVIFTSQQNLFIIDPLSQTIAGVYHKIWYDVSNCQSIPNAINTKTTLLMVDRPDEFYLRFMFEVFDIKKGEFSHKKLLTPLYKIKQGAQLQLYLKKNLQKIYTSNAFIHQYFLQKVEHCVSSIIQQQRSIIYVQESSQQIDRSEQMRMSMRQTQMKGGSELGRLFLQKFIMSVEHSKSLFDRFMFSLVNSGVKALFSNKNSNINYQRKSRKQSGSNLMPKRSSLQSQKSHLQNIETINNIVFRCQFDRWNQYFEEIMYEQYDMLNQLFVESGVLKDESNNGSEYSSSVENKFSILYENIKTIKHKLSLISKAYNRFLNLIQTSPTTQTIISSDNELTNSIRYYKQRIKQNINKVHSLYLIFDIFELGKGEKKGESCDKYLERIQCAVLRVFKEIEDRRKENILKYRRQQLLVGEKPLRINNMNINSQYNLPPLLMFHEHFTHSRLLAIPSQTMTFQLFLNYMLLDLENFEQIAYFYHITRREIINKQKIGNIKEKSDQDLQREYPFMSRNLVNFFYLIESVPVYCDKEQQINRQRHRIQKASRLSLLIKCPSFTNYLIQLCSLYSMPTTLIKLIDSQQIKPFIQNQIQVYKQTNIDNSLINVSQTFLFRERLIMRCLLYCVYGNKNNNDVDSQSYSINSQSYPVSLREILIYQMKRLNQIKNMFDLIKQKQKDTFIQNQKDTFMHNHRLRKSLILPLNQQQLKQQKIQQQNTDQHKFSTIKNILLQQFITMIMKDSSCQGIRLLQQLKNQCLSLQEDKIFFQSIVDKMITELKLKNQIVNHNKDTKNLFQMKAQ